MSERNFTPEVVTKTLAIMPEIRSNNQDNLLANLAPGQLPTELDNSLSTIIIDLMNSVKY